MKASMLPFSVSLHLEVRERSCQLATLLELVAAAEQAAPGEAGPARCCSPRHPTHFAPSSVQSDGTI